MRHLININLRVIALCIALIASSCENSEEVKIEMPETQTIECNAGDKPSFSFTAADSWQLSSDATWCKIFTAAGNVLDTSGSSGTHTITLNITDEGIKDEVTVANITLKIGSKSGVVARVERGAKALTMRILDIVGNKTDAIELGYIDWVPFRVDANFRFAATEFPEWVEFGVKEGNNIVSGAVIGNGDEELEAYARIVPNGERECYPIDSDEGYTVTFEDESRKVKFKFPIHFDGMGDDKLTFTAPTADTYGWEVSLDGTLFRQVGATEEETTTFENSLSYDIASRNKEYTTLLIEKVIKRGISSYNVGVDWMHFDNGTLTVDATDATRYGMVMALPNGIYNDIRNNIDDNLFELDYTSGVGLPTLKNDYLSYVLIEFTQHDFTEQGEYDGMYVYHSLTALEIPATPFNDSAVMAEYGVEEAYTVEFIDSIEGKRPGIVIDPRIELWTTATYDEGAASAEVYYKGEKLKISEDDYYLGENKDENMALYLWYPTGETFTENVYILFKVDNRAAKLLVVTPTTK